MRYVVMVLLGLLLAMAGVQPAMAANCGGLPASGGVIPAGTYTLTDNCVITATLEVDTGATVTINGGGFALDGDGAFNVFAVSGTLHLNNATIQNGFASDSGAGIMNGGTVYLTDVTLANNEATNAGGGIWALSDTTTNLTDVTFDANIASGGGGIWSEGTITMTGGLFIENGSVSGGAISNSGVLDISNVGIIGNTAFVGAGISNMDGNVTLTNVTLRGNQADTGGAILNDGTGVVSLMHVTVGGNSATSGGSGIANNAQINLKNSILALNSSDNCFNDTSGVITDQGGNLEDANTCGLSTGANTDPMLDTFNGEYFPLSAGSLAIDAAPDCAGLTEDQIGTSRPQGSACDIGAIEYTEVVAACPGLPVDGGVMPAGTYTLTDNCVITSPLEVAAGETVTIDGGDFAIDGSDIYRLFTVSTGSSLNLSNITLQNGYTANDGSAIYNDGGFVTLSQVVVMSNTADGVGTIYSAEPGELMISQSVIKNNTAMTGSAVLSDYTTNITNSTIAYNTDTAEEGAAVVSTSTFDVFPNTITLINVTIAENSRSGVYSTYLVRLQNTLIANNGELSCNRLPGEGSYAELGGNVIGDTGQCDSFHYGDNDPQLGTFTGEYFPIAQGSSAIDAGVDCAGITEDQIGNLRPQGVTCDSGAYEADLSSATCPGLPVTGGAIPSGTYTLTADCVITSTLVIENGATVTINSENYALIGNGMHRVLEIESGGTLVLNNAVVRNGNGGVDGGAGILNHGDLTVTDSTFHDNVDTSTGGGIYNLGTANIYGSEFHNNMGAGSGFYNEGTLNATDTLIHNNDVWSGVYNLADMTLIRVSVFNNMTNEDGGGIFNGDYSVSFSTATLTIINSTITGNAATYSDSDPSWSSKGGGIWNNGIINMVNVTLADNDSVGDGNEIWNDGTVNIRNTIISGNIAEVTCAGSGSYVDQGGNLENTNTCGLNTGANTDPLLGTFTGEYFPLRAGSPAIDTAPDCAGLTEDQIGTSRPQGSACDIGAIEIAQVAASCPGLPVDGGVIPAGTYTLTDNCVITSPLEVSTGETVTINGGDFAIDGSNTYRLFTVSAGGTLNLSNATLQNGYSATDGSAVFNNGGTVNINHVVVMNNTADGTGTFYNSAGTMSVISSVVKNNTAGEGSAFINRATLNVTNSTIGMNTSTNTGSAAIHSFGASSVTNLVNVTIAENVGGGVLSPDHVTLKSTIIYDNSVYDCDHQEVTGYFEDLGGNIAAESCGSPWFSVVDPQLGTFTGEYFPITVGSPAIDLAPDCSGLTEDQAGNPRPQGSACDSGAYEADISSVTCAGLPVTGGVLPSGTYTLSADCALTAPLVIQNGATVTIYGDGYALIGYARHRVMQVDAGGTLFLNDAVVRNGNATYEGAGIINYGTITVTDSSFHANVVIGNGGGIYNAGNATITGSEFYNNTGAGGAFFNDGTLTATDILVHDNEMWASIYNSGTMTLDRAAVYNNTGEEFGGAIANINETATLNIINSTITGNQATTAGEFPSYGGGLANTGIVNLTNATFAGNIAEDSNEIWNDGTVNIRNTIISGNIAEVTCAGSGSYVDQGGNLENTNTCGLSTGANIDPLLDTFNGEYFPLLVGSPAIDAAPDCAGLTEDQIGTSRPQGSACDIGAIEVDPSACPDGTSDADTLTCSVSPPVGINQEADVDGDDGADYIVIESGVTVQNVDGDGAPGVGDLRGTAQRFAFWDSNLNDTIINYGTVANIRGDYSVDCGNDIITNYGIVTDSIHGDDAIAVDDNRACSDLITNYGTVIGTIYADGEWNIPDTVINNGSVNTITADNMVVVVNSGTIEQEINTHGYNDYVILRDGTHGGVDNTLLVDGGTGNDVLAFQFTGLSPSTIAALEAANPANGSIVIDGQTINWQNFETIYTPNNISACPDGTSAGETLVCSANPPDAGNTNTSVTGDSGQDTITIQAGVTVDIVSGDASPWGDAGWEYAWLPNTASDDIITNYGTISSGLYGDHVVGDGANDHIILHGYALLVYGDLVFNGNGGDDIIENYYSIDASVQGDAIWFSPTTARQYFGGDDRIINFEDVFSITGDGILLAGSEAQMSESQYYVGVGGNDYIVNYGTAETLVGDSVYGQGGNDLIINHGIVDRGIIDPDNISILGDESAGNAGDDIIINTGTTRYIAGDYISDGSGGEDTIYNFGIVNNNIHGDQIFASAIIDNSHYLFDTYLPNEGVDDTIINAGIVNGSIYAEGGNDTVILGDGAGSDDNLLLIDGGVGTDTLTFAFTGFDLALLQGKNPAADSITVGGQTFQWINFEILNTGTIPYVGAVGFAQASSSTGSIAQTINIPVQLNITSEIVDSPLTIDLSYGGTAIRNTHYTAPDSITFTEGFRFTAGIHTVNVPVTLIAPQGLTTITIDLDVPAGVVQLAGNVQHTVNIQQGSINFQITEQQLFDAMQVDMLANPSEIDFILADFVPGAINFTVRTTDGTVTLVTMSMVIEGNLSRWEITSMDPSTQQTVIQQQLPGILTRSIIALTAEASVITDIDDTYLYITGEG